MLDEKNLGLLLFRTRYLKQKNYWTRKLSGQVETTDILKDLKKYRGDTFETGDTPTPVNREHYEISFYDELSRRILNICKHSELSLYIVLLTTLKALIHRYTYYKDVITISPIQGEKATSETINSLVLIRHYVDGTMTFKEVVLNVRNSVLEAYENQDYPYEKLEEYLFPSSSPSHISCWLENIHRQADIEKIKARLSFGFSREGEKIAGRILYDRNFYRESEIHRLADHFLLVLTGASENINTRISNIEFLTREERQQLLEAFNNNKIDFSGDKTLIQRIEEQMKKTPDSTAIVCEDRQITYYELNQRTNQLANRLKTYNPRKDQPLGILFRRSLAMVESILAAWKVGSAYIPLDTNDPVQRLQGILADSASPVLLSQVQWVAPQLEKTFNGNILLLNDRPKEARQDKGNRADLNLNIDPGSLAYVIYTSGSTGKPKGAMAQHIGMMNHIRAKIHDLQITPKSIVAQNASHTFDISVWQFFTALTNGGKTVIYPDKIVLEPYRFISRVTEDQVTILEVVPSYLSVMLEFLDAGFLRFDSLGYLLVTGETIEPGQVNQWFDKYPYVKMVNAYGPTEASDDITHFIMDKALDMKRVPIGKPVRNLNIHILDEYLNLCPLGVIGEICVSGIGVGRGYLNNPELTAEKFCSLFYRSYRSYKSYVLYKTGDLGRWLPGGVIEFFGRKDYQVKIRGFRIELGEIESRLSMHPGIKEAAVIVKTVANPYLCAYLVPSAGGKPTIPAIKEYLENHLPAHMVPDNFVELEHMPLTSNGKIDRKALSRLDDSIPVKKEYALPRGRLEKKLVQVWSKVLEIESPVIGIDANFFQLGGNSLRATVLIARLNKTLDVKIPLAQLFENPTIRELARYIEGLKQYSFVSIGAVEDKEYYPQSSSQKRLYVLQQMELEAAAYNVRFVVALEGELDKNRLEGMFRELIQRHESLRTSFHMIDEEPVQRIHEKVEFKIEYYDLDTNEGNYNAPVQIKGRASMTNYKQIPNSKLQITNKETGSHHSSKNRIIHHLFVRPFDLSCPPLLRVGLIKEQEQKHILMIDMHHIITDGVSMDLFVRETMSLYNGEKLSPLRLRYRDYSEWQTSERQKKAIQEQAEYWFKRFFDEVPVMNLPLDYSRPAIQSFEGNRLSFELPDESTGALKQLALDTGETLYMVLLTIYCIFLSKLSGQEDIVVGTPIAARRHSDLEGIIGMFVNTLALRNYPNSEKTVLEFLAEVKESTLQAFENQEYQFEDLVEWVSVNRDTSRNPLFDTMFALENMEAQANEITMVDIPQLRIKPYETEYHTAKFDLNLTCFETGEKLLCSLEYCTKLFKKNTIKRFIIYFQQILAAVLKDRNKKISQIEIITAEEKRQILYDFNDTAEAYPKDKTLHQLFEEQVERTPDHTALVGPKEEVMKRRREEANKEEEPLREESFGRVLNDFGEIQLSYGLLNEESNRLAYTLLEKGVQPDTIVGIMMERSVDMVIGILGILKAGGAYMPIAPGYPQERVDYMLKDSSAKILVTFPVLSEKFEKLLIGNCQLLMINEKSPDCRRLNTPPKEANSVNNYQLTINNLQLKGNNLAYIIYTSGSTGKPKGVMVEQGPVVNLLFALHYRYPLREQDTYLLKTSYLFDVSVTELFGWFLEGGRLAVLEPGGEKDPGAILEMIEREGVTHINFVPSMFHTFIEILDPREIVKLAGLKYIFLAGEALLPGPVNRFRRLNTSIAIENIYGPTEATVYAGWYSLADWKGEAYIPIGIPLPNVKLYILDMWGNLQPIAVTGELCISGAGLARGYLNQPGLTAEKFVIGSSKFSPNYQCPMTNDPLYKTGDLARWLPDSNIEFLGRIDHQVKIRGFRVELGEIEKRLLEHDEIKKVVVVIKTAEQGDKYLCAYFVPKSSQPGKPGCSIKESKLREYLLSGLPGYMIPSYFVTMDKLPLTPNGKVDRRKLPEPEIKVGEGRTSPRDEIEKKMVEIWSEILNIPYTDASYASSSGVIGIDDNFFELGGHSLKMMKMISLVHKELNVKLTMVQVFETPRIRKLAELIKGGKIDKYSSIAPVEKKEYYVVSSAQRRMYIVHLMKGESCSYNTPTAVHVIGQLDCGRLQDTFRELIQRHESLRTYFIMLGDEPVQRILHVENVPFTIEYFDLPDMGPLSSIEEIRKDFIRPFDLSQAPLLRIGLIKVDESEYILMIDMYHIIGDGISHYILQKEFMLLYARHHLPQLRLQYKDFSEWQNSHTVKAVIKQQEEFWLTQLDGEISVLNLHADFNEVDDRSSAGSSFNFIIDEEQTTALKAMVSETDATLYIILLAIYYVLLSKLSGQEDIIVGSPAAGRWHPDLEHIVGMFVNMLALRNYPKGEMKFKEFLKEVKARILDVLENQDYPFDDLVAKIGQKRDTTGNQLFDVVFQFDEPDELPEEKFSTEGTHLPLMHAMDESLISPFALAFIGNKRDGQLHFKIEYSTSLFKQSTIEEISNRFIEIVNQVIKNKNIKLEDITISHGLLVADTNILLANQEKFEF